VSGTAMNCRAARLAVLDEQRGRLDDAASAALATHLRECAGCARDDAAERLLTELLERQLPQHAAPLALKRRLAAQWPARLDAPSRARRSPGWRGALAAAALVLAILGVWAALFRAERAGPLVAEAVNDHLRILARIERLDIASGDMHTVRPWLTGRLDFAPVVPFPGDADFPLRGGAVEYFLDRRAAVAVYGRRLHVVTLLVTRPDGLPWPDAGRSLTTRSRGFNVRLWRAHGLAYALVSDLDVTELGQLAARLGG
jgi:anti-sigma factor RsiW